MTSKRTTLEWKKLFESEQFEKDYFYNGNDLGYTLTEEDKKLIQEKRKESYLKGE